MRRLITLATLSVVLVTCLVTWACTPKGLTKEEKLEAAKKLLMKGDPRAVEELFMKIYPQGWEARLLEAQAQVEARRKDQRQVEAAKLEAMAKKLIMKIDPREWEAGLLEASGGREAQSNGE